MILFLLDAQFAGDSDSDTWTFHKVTCIEIFGYFNVLYIWPIRAIPTYRVYRLYDTMRYQSL